MSYPERIKRTAHGQTADYARQLARSAGQREGGDGLRAKPPGRQLAGDRRARQAVG
ncbi:MAG: hypothetical protein LC777_00455 [Actinobacteria bacterium]|nr:hypothetical protein [Actinomycetota bacterium]